MISAAAVLTRASFSTLQPRRMSNHAPGHPSNRSSGRGGGYRPASRSVAEILERRQHRVAAHGTHHREQIPRVLLFAGAFTLHQPGGVFVDGRMVLPPVRRSLDAVELAAIG